MNFLAQESPQKLRGGYYTPSAVARFLAGWALAGGRDRLVLEPSCGDGAFLPAIDAAGARACEVVACELEPSEAAAARERAAALERVRLDLHAGDFLAWALARLERPLGCDAAVGNPPFIRYQYLPEAQQAVAERLFGALELPFTRHVNAWVPFVVAALHHLRPGGRLAMVVPSELLHVLHAQGLRDQLLARCARVLVVDPEELLFAGTLQGTALLLAEKALGAAACELSIAPVRDLAFLDRPAEELWTSATSEVAELRGRKWMRALLSPRERAALAAFAACPGVTAFARVASVDVGIVTGANGFFLVPDAVVAEHRLERWARPMFGRSSHVRGVVYDAADHARNRREGLPANFIDFGATPSSRLSAAARRYLARGEAEGLPGRYKCRTRSPWWNVPSVSVAPVAMLKRSHHFPRLVLNRVGALTTDTAYRIAPAAGTSAELLVAAFVNGATALSAELEGRHYGGGVLELVPSEIERLLLPCMPPGPGRKREREWLAALHARSAAGAREPEALLAEQDARVLAAVGLALRDREALRGAWARLRARRQRVAR